MKRGISFEIPNQYGKYLDDILKPVDVTAFDWKIGDGESYKVVKGKLADDLFPESPKIMDGATFQNIIEYDSYYLIFSDLQAYPRGHSADIGTYEAYLESPCELVLLVVDCTYVTIYCKDKVLLELLHEHSVNAGFTSIEYITDKNDTRTSLKAW